MTRVEKYLRWRRFTRLVFRPVVAIALIEFFAWLIARTSADIAPDMFLFRQWAILIPMCGLVRAATTQPAWRVGYANWLKTTPWNSELALPEMPAQLVWEDVLLLSVFCAFALTCLNCSVLITLSLYMIGYLSVQLFALGRNLESRRHCAALAVGLPGVVLLYPDVMLIAPLLLILYLITLHGFGRMFAAFPWPQFKSKAARNPGWPNSSLGPASARSPLPLVVGILIGLYSGWLFSCGLAVMRLIGPPHAMVNVDERVLEFLKFIVVMVASVRLAVYVAGNWPPISFAGRLTTGRLLIPRYDCALAAPALICGVMFLPRALAGWRLPLLLNAGVTVSLAMAAALELPPSLSWWKLCGEHRMWPGPRGGNAFESLVTRIFWPGALWRKFLLAPWWTLAGFELILWRCAAQREWLPGLLLTVLAAASYALYRIVYIPVVHQAYARWLKNTPWNSQLALPAGPVQLSWQDLLAIAIMEASAQFWLKQTGPTPWGIATLAFLTVHSMTMTLVLRKSERLAAGIVSLGTPLALWFVPTLYGKLAGIALLSLLGQFAVRRWLKTGLRSELDHEPPAGNHAALFGLGYRKPVRIFKLESLLSISIWIYVCFGFAEWLDKLSDHVDLEKMHDGLKAYVFLILAAAAMLRLLHYVVVYRPPINFFGRFRNGGIIPEYDVIFLAPICTALTSVFVPYALESAGCPTGLAVSVSAFAALFINRYMGPDLHAWQLSGFHTIRLSATVTPLQRAKRPQ